MRKIGTISAAAGFIFLGVWMIINQNNAALGDEVFKWWPIIIIILGAELLLSFKVREENHRMRLNGLIIPVIILFLFVNIFKDVRYHVGEGFRWIKESKNFNEVVDILRNIDDQNYKIIKAAKLLEPSGNTFEFNTNNGDVTILRSQDGKIKMDAEIYVSQSREDSSYDIKERKEASGYKVILEESYIKKVKVNLYIPDGLNLKLDGENLRLISEEEFPNTKFYADVNNGSIDIRSADVTQLKINNGKVGVKDIKDLTVKSNNAVVNVDGNTEVMAIEMNNGMVSVNNKLSKNVNISVNSGTVKLITEDQDAEVKLLLDKGPCVLNGERRINSGISKTFGTGSDKVKIDVDNGMVTFIN